jgi:hypothetical protein
VSERDNILRGNQLAREQRIPTRHAPFAEHTLRIPTRDWYALTLIFPGLRSRNRDEFQAAMDALHASDFANLYRVRTRRAQLGHL